MDLAAVFDEWGSRLFAYMITITRDRHRAEDALQNLFMKLAVSRSNVRHLKVYLFTAARNEAIRASRRRPEEPLDPSGLLAPSRNGIAAADLEASLAKLPAEQAEVVILHSFEGLTFEEISEVLGVPAGTVASRHRYAVEKLKESLGS